MRDLIPIVILKTFRLLAEPRWENKLFVRLLLLSHHNGILSHFCSHRNYSGANIMRIKSWIRFVSVAVLKGGKKPLLSCPAHTWYGYKVHQFISQFVKRLYNTTRVCCRNITHSCSQNRCHFWLCGTKLRSFILSQIFEVFNHFWLRFLAWRSWIKRLDNCMRNHWLKDYQSKLTWRPSLWTVMSGSHEPGLKLKGFMAQTSSMSST